MDEQYFFSPIEIIEQRVITAIKHSFRNSRDSDTKNTCNHPLPQVFCPAQSCYFFQNLSREEHRYIRGNGTENGVNSYFDYCGEVGCDVWGTLLSMDSLCGEPVCLWLPEQYKLPETSTYVQGVEVAEDYDGVFPEGFDVITLPDANYLMFQGEPFDEEDYCDAIFSVQTAMDRYEPSVIGYCWDDANPRIQLEPRGERGYIEMRAVHKERGAQK